MNGQGHEIINAIFQAKDYRPDGIVTPDQYRDVITVDEQASSVTYPYSALNEILKGLRKKELVTVCAGSGVGKSTFIKEIIYHLMHQTEGWRHTARRVRKAVTVGSVCHSYE